MPVALERGMRVRPSLPKSLENKPMSTAMISAMPPAVRASGSASGTRACEGRTCAAGQQCYKELVAWDGSEAHNVCGPDPQCLANTDCAAGQVCVPPFGASPGVILTDRGGVCITPECHVDADCMAAPCGACRLLVKQVSINSGRDALDGIKCVYGTSTK